MERDNKVITPQQRLALKNFERFKTSRLSGLKDERKFEIEFQRLQSMAKLRSFEDFLKEEFL